MSPDLVPVVEAKKASRAPLVAWTGKTGNSEYLGSEGRTLGRQNEGDIKLIIE
jgi:hypothetical protein